MVLIEVRGQRVQRLVDGVAIRSVARLYIKIHTEVTNFLGVYKGHDGGE